MGGIYALRSFISIVAMFGQEGITKHEIIRKNEESYESKLDFHFDFASSASTWYVEFIDGKYYPRLDNLDMGSIEQEYIEVMEKRAAFEK